MESHRKNGVYNDRIESICPVNQEKAKVKELDVPFWQNYISKLEHELQSK